MDTDLGYLLETIADLTDNREVNVKSMDSVRLHLLMDPDAIGVLSDAYMKALHDVILYLQRQHPHLKENIKNKNETTIHV